MSRRRRERDPDLHGVLLLDKPAGPTSHDVVSWVRWVMGVRRVGHCGTLDPAATGLLVVAVGLATKLATHLTGQDKAYRACIVLGARTTTADAQGDVLEQCACPADLEARVPEAVEGLRGAHQLPPPAFSAVHVDGRRAHELARAGEDPALAPRPMTVHAIEPGAVRRVGERVEVDATLHVSKGTYIRSLAEALGAALGVPAHLGALHRLRSGALSLEHPRAVTGLSARRLEATRPGPPRWRVERGESADRAELAAFLRSRMLTPAEAVPLPLLRVGEGPSGSRALARLASGQAVAVDDPGLPAVPDHAERLAVGPASASAAGLVIVRHLGLPARLEPERVVIPPALDP